MHWPDEIPPGNVINLVGAAMDVFPTFLSAAGGDLSKYQLDGLCQIGVVCDGWYSPHTDLYWEMGDQTAMRQNEWKLVLNGRLEEGAPPEDDVHLANLETDMGETTNLKDEYPEITAEMTEAAQSWRQDIEDYWETHKEERNGTTGYVK